MINHSTTEVFFDNVHVPVGADRRRGQGFRYILSGMNAERILIAAECIGDAKWFLEKARPMRETALSSERRSAGTRVSSSHWRGRSLI